MMVITSGRGLSEYISELLPSQGVAGVRVSTFEKWSLEGYVFCPHVSLRLTEKDEEKDLF